MQDVRRQLPVFVAGLCCLMFGGIYLSTADNTTRIGVADYFWGEAEAKSHFNDWSFFTLAAGPQDAALDKIITSFIAEHALPYKREEVTGPKGGHHIVLSRQISGDLSFVIRLAPNWGVDFGFQGWEAAPSSYQEARREAERWYAFVNERFPDHAVREIPVNTQKPRYSRPAKGEKSQ
ncbi:hypothetical protein ACFSM5_05220 [Lacibacterium aquatile]|uniref:DUF695 domain-containing protein n=1 Tax=Lacibacterium aquatile TaxID=1168082 RepID=A0ABW5DMX3_9PROT